MVAVFQPGDVAPYQGDSVLGSGFAVELEKIAPSITEKITEQQAPGESWIDSLARLLPILAASEQQRQLLQIQAERARQGLPPLNTSQYGTGLQVGISADTKQMLIWGALGLGVVLWMRR